MSSSRVDLPTQLYTSDILLYLLFANIFMARQFESESKGWHQNFPKHIGRLEATFQTCDKIKTDEDECIYYPLVYGQEEKLKIIANPQGRYGPYKKTNSQSPLKKTYMKENKTISYGTEDDGCYALLRGNATQADIQSAPRHQFGSRAGQELPAPVPRSVLRSLSYDLQQNKNHDHRVMTLEPCRQHMQVSLNNNYEQHVKKASGHSPHDGLNGDNSEELLDYCTCMCCVKGVFYHFTKDCEDEGHMADQPCSCDGPLSLCVPRWGCLGIFSLFLPCLCCYLPAKGCLKLQQCSSKNNQEWK